MPKRLFAGVLLMALISSLLGCNTTIGQSSKLTIYDCNILFISPDESNTYITTRENVDTTTQVGFSTIKQGFQNSNGGSWKYFDVPIKLSSEWKSTSVLPPTRSQPAIANIASIVRMTANPFGLGVTLKPINAKANISYVVELYEKGKLRTTQTVTWNQPQINVGSEQTLFFGLTSDEYDAYSLASLKDINWWKLIFSIKIH
jgi:hypothetical protein